VWALNTVVLDPVETPRMRVVFTHEGTMRPGMTELRIFPPGDQDLQVAEGWG